MGAGLPSLLEDGKECQLFSGDNLDALRRHVGDGSVDLCYIDPPFYSQREYGAFTDVWAWDAEAARGYEEMRGWKVVELLRGVLGEGGLLAYLVSLTRRIVEIHRVLKSTGSLFLHCDPTAGHYLKVILDAVFGPGGGGFRNEIVWCYTGPGSPGMKQFMRKHDTIFWFSKGPKWTFNADAVRTAHAAKTRGNYKAGLAGSGFGGAGRRAIHAGGKVPEDWWPLAIAPRGKEYRGYPTQKPEALLRRIILAASHEGDVVLDAYCGGGTSLAAAQELGRRWIGMDINPQALRLARQRLAEKQARVVGD